MSTDPRAAPADVFLSRQPILDRRRRVIAYELLHRRGREDEAQVSDDGAATARVMRHMLRDLGVETVLGRCHGFINVDAEMLMSTRIEALPRERVVLELLETVEVDDALLSRCRALKARGFRLALDDFVTWHERYEPLLALADIVKVDILQLDPAALVQLVSRLRLYPARLLAEKVENCAVARRCLQLGFDLFQGFYFARPAPLAA